MNRTLRRLLSGMLIAIVAGGVWVTIFGWPLFIIRDNQYRKLISDFQQAQVREKLRCGYDDERWEFQVQIPEKQTAVQVSTHLGYGVVGIKYADEAGSQPLYKYFDYSSPVEIRTEANILYVYWTEMLLYTEDWLLAYDLANRREIIRRRIDRNDLRKP